MDDRHFDHFARVLAISDSRRRVLAALAGLSVMGGLLGILGGDDVEAGRRQRRKRRHQKRHNRGKNRKHRKPKKPKCAPVCTGKCGGADDGCGGTCNGSCADGQICDSQTCQMCDVCASGCASTTIQAAIAAAESGDTVRVCAGTYDLAAGENVVLDKNLTLVGGGASQTGTVIDGQDLVRAIAVVRVNFQTNVELRNLVITGANRTTGGDRGGGIENSGDLVLTGVLVTDNTTAGFGGGIWNDLSGSTTLNSGTSVTRNHSGADGGGIYTNSTPLTLKAGSSVTDNTAMFTGGGIYVGGPLTIEPGATLANNSPDDCFGGSCPA